jgi:hypothetical protein
MIAFWNAAILYLVLVKGGKVNDGYKWFLDKIAPRLGRVVIELLTCVFCLAFWIALIEGLIGGHSFIDIGINWVLTVILYKFLNL